MYGIVDDTGQYLQPGLDLTDDAGVALRFEREGDAEWFLRRWACDPSLAVQRVGHSLVAGVERQHRCVGVAAKRALSLVAARLMRCPRAAEA